MEKTKIKRINALDFVIIVIIVFCVASFVMRFQKGEELASYASEGKYEISFLVNDVRYTTADAFVKGDRVYVATDDHYIGTFEHLDSNNPAAYYAETPEEGIVKVYYPEGTRVDLTGTIISNGFMNDDGYFAGGSYFLAPGKRMTIYTGHVYVEVVLTDIVPYAE
ncbi:MAG: DUF4330 family protein [Clostridia bacterium]|nr:DUF4330 family protein [Clostridia bacterium]